MVQSRRDSEGEVCCVERILRNSGREVECISFVDSCCGDGWRGIEEVGVVEYAPEGKGMGIDIVDSALVGFDARTRKSTGRSFDDRRILKGGSNSNRGKFQIALKFAMFN